MSMGAPTVQAVRRAAKHLRGVLRSTPLIESDALNARTGGRIFLKAECLQRCGSFKVRGAYALLAERTPEERKRGVVAWSSGNHGLGVAYAAGRLAMSATLVMPKDAPAIKVRKASELGADIVFYDRRFDDREEIGTILAEEDGAIIAPSYDHPHIIAGQGTVAIEIIEEMEAVGVSPDTVLVCCGGGGLAAGVALALSDQKEKPELVTVEPVAFDDMARSLAAGRRLRNHVATGSICDSLLAPEPGAITFPILSAYGASGVAVSDEEVRAAMRFAFSELKLVLEPGGAVSLAAALFGKVPLKGKTAALTLTGGNVDQTLFRNVLESGPPEPS